MFKIRKAEQDDLPRCVELLKQLFSIEADFDFDYNKNLNGLKLFLENKNNRIIHVGIHNSKIIGMAAMQLVISSAEGNYSGLVEDMVIDKDYRNKKYGKKILNSLLDWAYRKGVTRIQLLADKNNIRALNFYKKNKWQKTSLIVLRKRRI